MLVIASDQYDDELGQQVQRIFSLVAGLAAIAGYDKEQLTTMFAAALQSIDSSSSQFPVKKEYLREHTDFVAYMLGCWRNDSEYVEPNGDPKLLPLDGETLSLRSLFEHVTKKSVPLESPLRCEDAIDMLIKHKAIKEMPCRRFQAIVVSLNVNDQQFAGIHSQLSYVEEFVSTVVKNTNTPGKEGKYQAVASVPAFPVESLQMVHAILVGPRKSREIHRT